MSRTLKVAFVVALLWLVVFVIANPLVAPEPTLLQQLRASVLLLVAIVLACTSAMSQMGSYCRSIVSDNSASLRKDSLRRIDLTGIWRC
jgi:hypothetical protein